MVASVDRNRCHRISIVRPSCVDLSDGGTDVIEALKLSISQEHFKSVLGGNVSRVSAATGGTPNDQDDALQHSNFA